MRAYWSVLAKQIQVGESAILLLVVLALLLPTGYTRPAFGQVASCTLSVQFTDPSGAVIP